LPHVKGHPPTDVKALIKNIEALKFGYYLERRGGKVVELV